ncbi:MAG TPA: Gfo/Idh/MocA family oxidoreductase [Nocardioidaceae bacterium]|nr:Gfo/Idh/MocA family oxidoreductase [Nocardioidaceae bacterium]
MAQDFSSSRRAFLKGGTASGAALGISGLAGGFTAEAAADTARAPAGVAAPKGSMIGVPFEPRDVVRVAVIGLGNRGGGMAELWAQHPDVRVTAICDVRPERVESVAAQLRSMGHDPATYAGGDPSYEAALDASELAMNNRDADQPYAEMCARDDIDFIYVPTPWEWHFPMAMTAMRHGKHVGTEVPLTMEMDHLWALVAASERTRRHCFLMEQIVYSQNEMRILRMAHEGKFGDLLHGAGGYNHDIRGLMFGLEGSYYPSNWRRLWHTRRDGCFYPTHGLAPIAACMDINRGDRFTSLISGSTPAMGLELYREEHAPPDHDSWGEDYVAGDRSVTLVETARGRLIRVEHDVSHPHPYSRLNHLAGTRGIFEDFTGGSGTDGGGTRIYLEPDHSGHEWGSFDAYADFDHWMWKFPDDPGTGHGGSDSKEVWRFVQMMKLGLVPDHDVYDGAVWTVVNPLSTKSLERNGAPVQIPDFTGGHWREYRDGIDSPRPTESRTAVA